MAIIPVGTENEPFEPTSAESAKASELLAWLNTQANGNALLANTGAQAQMTSGTNESRIAWFDGYGPLETFWDWTQSAAEAARRRLRALYLLDMMLTWWFGELNGANP